MSGKAFLDSNVLLYLISGDEAKARRAEALLGAGGIIAVQVLNEFAAVAHRKYGVPWPALREQLGIFKHMLHVVPLTLDLQERGVDIAERYRFDLNDAMLLAVALSKSCTIFWSEDMGSGQAIEGLTIRNPFRVSAAG